MERTYIPFNKWKEKSKQTEYTEPTKLLDWMDSDIDSNYVYPERVFVVDDENLIAIEEKWNDEGTVYSVVNLKKTPSSELPEKKIITLAAIYLDYDAKEDILEFNRTNPEYRIRVTDYSEYASGEDYYGLTKLNTEIHTHIIINKNFLIYISS